MTSPRETWSRETVLSFINDYQANACLWDKRLPSYRDTVRRYETWRKLAKKYNCNIAHIKEKINTLRRGFKKSHKRYVEGTAKDTSPSSYYYKPMSFLLDILKIRGHMKWTRDTLLSLIANYRANPCLWNFKDPSYKDETLKEAAWHKLAKEYNCDAEVVMRKINELRGYLSRQVQRMKNKRIDATKYTPRWYYYRPMFFLLKLEDESLELQDDDGGINKKWYTKLTMSLIDEYRANPCLWNFNDPSYTDEILKEAVWHKMAPNYNCSADVLKRKIHQLRQSLLRYVKRMKYERSIGGVVSTAKWHYYKPLSFLLELEGESLELLEDDENKVSEQNETVGMLESRSSSSKLSEQNGNSYMMESRSVDHHHINVMGNLLLQDNMSLNIIKIENDSDLSNDSEQCVECLSLASSVSQSTDETNKHNSKVEIFARKRPAQYNFGAEEKFSDEDSKYSESLFRHTREMPQNKKMFFGNDSIAQDNFNEEDRKFLNSLLSHIRMIPPHEKLRFRNVMQGLVQKFAYNDSVENNAQVGTPSYLSPGTYQYQLR